MAQIEKIATSEGEKLAIELPFEASAEPWNVYLLSDGGKVKLKLVVTKIFQIVDEHGNPIFLSTGEPFVSLRYQQIVSATANTT